MATPEKIEEAKRLLRIRRAEERLARLRAQAEQPALSAGQALVEGVQAFPGDVARLGGAAYDAVTSPIDTAVETGKGIAGLIGTQGSQARSLAMSGLGPDEIEARLAQAGDNPARRAMLDEYAERYGGWENIKRSFAERPAETLLDALTVVAPSMQVAGRAMSTATRAPDTRAFVEGAPTTEQLKDTGSALYKGLRTKSTAAIGTGAKGGVTVPADAYRGFADKLAKRMSAEGLDPVLHPTAARVLQIAELPAGASSVKLPLLMNLRRHFGQASRSAEPSEARLGEVAKEMLDDFMERDLPDTAGQAKAARGTWAKMRKSELIDDAIERARSRPAGFEAGLRNEFGALWRNKKKMRGFTDAEKKAIFAVADGTWTANQLRRLGSLGGGSGQQRNVLNAIIAGGGAASVGAATAGPVGALALGLGVPAAGYGAARLAERATKRRADLARAVVARGETPAQARVPRPMVQATGRAMAKVPPHVAALMGAGYHAVQGPDDERIRALRGY